MKTFVNILLISLVSGCLTAFAQEDPLQEAIKTYKAGNLDEARKFIDIVTKDEQYTDNPTSWYLRGFIYKDLYKKAPEADSLFTLRTTAIEAFRNLLEKDSESKYTADALKNLKFLVVTFYNDAIKAVTNRKFNMGKKSFELFKDNMQYTQDKSIDIKSKELDFYFSLAIKYAELHEKEETKGDTVYLHEAKMAYHNILNIDASNTKVNYNLAVLYYNEAVNMISALEYEEIDLIAFGNIEDKSIALFKKSLPYMTKAYELDPTNKSTIEGLAGIYFSLRDFDKSNEFKAKLAELE